MTDSQNKLPKTLVIGDGSWGTSLAMVLAGNGVPTTLWSAFSERSAELAKDRENKRYLPGIAFPESLALLADPFEAAQGVELCVSVVPTQFLRGVAERFEDALGGQVPIVSATKGLEIETFKRPTEILAEILGERSLGVLTGPSHAEEVARKLPASVVVASKDKSLAKLAQAAFTSDSFRVYTSSDDVGAELGGALKNVIALAAGMSDGLGLGDNAKAALLTRGMVEMARYGQTHGAELETFFGLAGVGDLITTACSGHSRNRAVGEAIGKGKKLEQVLEEMNMVAEGVWTTRALFGPESENRAIELPIAAQVHAILFDDKDPREAVQHLMQREPAAEMEGLTKGGA